MQILVEIARQEYDQLEYFYAQVCSITAEAARGPDEKVGAQGIEVWTSIAEEEHSRKKKGGVVKGYVAQSSAQLIILLLECIQRLNIEDEDEEDDQFGVYLSAGCCLVEVAQVIGNDII
jgi:hypothetical protein